ncbi:hypothetical protein LR48_Vigan05g156500 [Vigna angularis]|uniref:Uncharacterized protein n=1 Tax=Phaseolus angularis TaxID=3914 RepID=A0A0L9UM58_PHAAN|nr:hypothetical protein LR48_Vigan05g156500 [Vigna angularis]
MPRLGKSSASFSHIADWRCREVRQRWWIIFFHTVKAAMDLSVKPAAAFLSLICSCCRGGSPWVANEVWLWPERRSWC